MSANVEIRSVFDLLLIIAITISFMILLVMFALIEFQETFSGKKTFREKYDSTKNMHNKAFKKMNKKEQKTVIILLIILITSIATLIYKTKKYRQETNKQNTISLE